MAFANENHTIRGKRLSRLAPKAAARRDPEPHPGGRATDQHPLVKGSAKALNGGIDDTGSV